MENTCAYERFVELNDQGIDHEEIIERLNITPNTGYLYSRLVEQGYRTYAEYRNLCKWDKIPPKKKRKIKVNKGIREARERPENISFRFLLGYSLSIHNIGARELAKQIGENSRTIKHYLDADFFPSENKFNKLRDYFGWGDITRDEFISNVLANQRP